MTDRNLLLGGGERLTSSSPVKRGSGPKNRPYKIADIRQRIEGTLSSIAQQINELPSIAKPRSEGVFELTLHPAYLARTYYPKNLLRAAGLRDIGSKEATIVPHKVTNLRDEGRSQATATLFVAGQVSGVERMRSLLMSDSTSIAVQRDLEEIENIRWIDPEEKIKGQVADSSDAIAFEVALHAGAQEEDIVAAFNILAKKFEARVDLGRRIHAGGLTFVPVYARADVMRYLAQFSFLRVARPMPPVRSYLPNVVRQSIDGVQVQMPATAPVLPGEKAAIFDGGLGTDDLKAWANEFTYTGTESTHGSLLMHGSEVTSTFLFGRTESTSPALQRPYLNVDHYRVLAPSSGKDPDLFDVLHRIRGVLDTGEYRFANLSLGPRMPIDDGEVHAWTATLDQLCARHGIFLTVAVGNDGLADGANRIQPPADMVNAVAVGAADSSADKWQRASYSCIGPGRSPGYVKPDGLAFGGSDKEPFTVYNPLINGLVAVQGTSYASPLVLRTAAGIQACTTLDLSTIAIKALMVHKTQRRKSHQREEVGWGRFPEQPMHVLECEPGAATVIFQDTLAKGDYRRCPIPFPDQALPGKVEIKATFCLHAQTDPEHAVNYTRSGIGVVFRPRLAIEDESAEFFGRASQYKKSERQHRDDAHKWETTLHRSREFTVPNSLAGPAFDVEYHAREASRGVPAASAPDVRFALVVTIKADGVPNLYDLVRQKYPVLAPVELRQEVILPSGA